MKKLIIKAISIVITAPLAILLPFISNIATVFGVNMKDWFKANYPFSLSLLIIIWLIFSAFVIIKLLLSYISEIEEKNNINTETNFLRSQLELCKKELILNKSNYNRLLNDYKELQNTINSKVCENQRSQFEKRKEQSEMAGQILDLMSEIKKILLEISKYDNVKTRHRNEYQIYKNNYLSIIDIINDDFESYLSKDGKNFILNILENIFTKSSIESLRNTIRSESSDGYISKNDENRLINEYFNEATSSLTRFKNYCNN